MEKRLRAVYEQLFNVYSELVSVTKAVTTDVKRRMTDPEYCADVAFALNECDKLLKDIGVEVRRTQELAESIAVFSWLQSADEEPIRTEHCTATPKLKMQPATPPRDSAEMAELLNWLGMSRNHDAVRIHWPTLCDIVSKCVEESQPLPACIKADSLHNPSMRLQFYKRKGLLE